MASFLASLQFAIPCRNWIQRRSGSWIEGRSSLADWFPTTRTPRKKLFGAKELQKALQWRHQYAIVVRTLRQERMKWFHRMWCRALPFLSVWRYKRRYTLFSSPRFFFWRHVRCAICDPWNQLSITGEDWMLAALIIGNRARALLDDVVYKTV